MACVFREQFRNPRPEHTRERTLPKKIGKVRKEFVFHQQNFVNGIPVVKLNTHEL